MAFKTDESVMFVEVFSTVHVVMHCTYSTCIMCDLSVHIVMCIVHYRHVHIVHDCIMCVSYIQSLVVVVGHWELLHDIRQWNIWDRR